MEFDFKTTLSAALISMVVALLTGRFLKKLVILIVSPFVKKTETKMDDKLLEAARHDFGLPPEKPENK